MTNKRLTAGSVPSPAFFRLANDEDRQLSTSHPKSIVSFAHTDEELGAFPGPRPGGAFCGFHTPPETKTSSKTDSQDCYDEEIGLSGYPIPCQGGHAPCLISSDEDLDIATHQMQQCFGCQPGGGV
ncbi:MULTISPECIES: hypothetical protein [Thalassospira]|uniref:Uncharacterized protein n=2 Tax=Thalassospira TaxID=168934 RepID=A0A367WBD5_9PROT|nr:MULTISPECIES: hypothetical protein [Thalassospira]MDG4717989.1 hypothetical protein [Thalassospira sp. FZY0004]RCK37770.1 hypothetical protein TH19_06940 [Thalassospira profundimaris]